MSASVEAGRMPSQKHRSKEGKQSQPRSGNVRRWTSERSERELAKDLPRNPLLVHLHHLMFAHDLVHQPLFHYTSQQAAKNIIRTNSIRASDAYQVNDSQEVAYPCSLLRKEIRRCQIYFQKRGNRLLADMCTTLLDVLATPRDCYPAVFVFCLTEHTKSKKHWHDYSTYEGYALGFRFRTPLTLGLFVPGPDAVIRRVVYDPDLQREMLMDVVDKFLRLVSETMRRVGASSTESLPEYLAKSFVENLKDFASRVVVSIKHPSFQHEREWRVIVAPMPGVIEDDFQRATNWIKARHLAGDTRNYTVLVPQEGELLPLSSMIAGPACEAEAKKRLNDVLRETGHKFRIKDAQ